MLNVSVIMGRLTKDPELRTSTSGITYCRFTVAVDRNYVKQGEERKADFISCIAWRQQAEFINRYFAKGSMIAVEGALQTGSYVNKDGVTIYTTDLVANNVSFTGSKRESGTGGNTQQTQQNYGNAYGANASTSYRPSETSYSSGSPADFIATPLDEDLPF